MYVGQLFLGVNPSKYCAARYASSSRYLFDRGLCTELTEEFKSSIAQREQGLAAMFCTSWHRATVAAFMSLCDTYRFTHKCHYATLKATQLERETIMEKLARHTFRIGSIGFIAIGALHTYVHLTELAGDELQGRFDQMGDIMVQGGNTAAWDLFQGLSLLMGFFSIILGITNLAAQRAAGRPPVGVSLANVAMLGSIVIIGVLHLGPLQVYGGMFGITMFAIPVIAAVRETRHGATAAPNSGRRLPVTPVLV